MIRKADVENHNKDGGLWIVIHGKVYDVQAFKDQAPCGSEVFQDWAGTYVLTNKPLSILTLFCIKFLSCNVFFY